MPFPRRHDASVRASCAPRRLFRVGLAPNLPQVSAPFGKSLREPARSRECGASMLESTVCLLALVLAAFTVFEIAQWHVTRHLARLALHAAAREGAVTNANPQTIRRAATIALASRYAPASHRSSAQVHDVDSIPEQVNPTGLSPWRVDILSPSAPMFADFADAELSRSQRRSTIRNDFLAEQHAAHHARGWDGGNGPQSGKNIFDANTLRLRLTVLHAPRVPGVAMLVRALVPTGEPITDAAHRNGLLAITIEADSAMHSHPMLWVEPSRRRDDAILASNARFAWPQAAGARQNGNSGGARLRNRDDAPDTSPGAGEAPGAIPGTSAFASPTHRAEFAPITGTLPTRSTPAADRLTTNSDTDALCGILLCCRAN